MPRISQLPSLTAADNADELAIVDVSASTTKKVTKADLLKGQALTNLNGGTTAGVLTTDASGAVTANTAPTGTNWPAVNVNTSNSNVNSDIFYDQYTYTIPANASGRYFMSFGQQMTTGNASNDFTTSITVNGTEVVSTASGGGSYVNYIVPTSIWAGPLNAGDVVKCRSKGGGAGGSYSTRFGRFTIMRII